MAGALLFAQQQMADPDFAPKVARPAYVSEHPQVWLDEAHFNFHTASGRYKPFADLLRADGYEVVPNTEKFSAATLASKKILVISNALGHQMMGNPAASNPAFTPEECDAVRDWVRAGGALLLIADHSPMGAANQSLADRFGVHMSKGYTGDAKNHDPESNSDTFLLFTRENKLLADHPITRGRDGSEQISKILTFTGQSLKGPAESTPILALSDSATEVPAPTQEQIQAAIAKTKEKGLSPGSVNVDMPPDAEKSAAGRNQGLALPFGKGRVVMMGEAGFMSAQVVTRPQRPVLYMGMNRPGYDNQQMVLNVLHWLSGLLPLK